MPELSDHEPFQRNCGNVLDKLAGVVDGDVSLQADDRRHVESCLKCQAELVRYRRLLKAMHDLRTHVVQPHPGLLADILDNLGERGERRAIRGMLTGRKAAYTGGLAVAAVAGVTGAVLLAGRSKKNSKRAA